MKEDRDEIVLILAQELDLESTIALLDRHCDAIRTERLHVILNAGVGPHPPLRGLFIPSDPPAFPMPPPVCMGVDLAGEGMDVTREQIIGRLILAGIPPPAPPGILPPFPDDLPEDPVRYKSGNKKA